jgi:hypothetical protein
LKEKTGIIGILGCIAVCIALSGCGKEATESCIEIGKDGTISQKIVEDFSESNYDLEELRTMTQEEIDAYCEEAGEDAVELIRLIQKDGTVSMELEYKSAEDYSAFNEDTFFVGTIEEALEEEKQYFPDNFIQAKDGSQVKQKTVFQKENRHIVIFSDTVLYETNQKILYYSENVQLVSGKSARLKDSEKGPAYLIY